MKTTKMAPGRGWAYLGLLLGLAGSVTGNVANTVLTVSHVDPTLRVCMAVAWPIWTWVGIEVLTRTQWRRHWSHWLTRAILMGPTSLVAAFVSYLHLHHLMVMSGEPGLAQAVGPLAIDGTLFGCTVALLVTRAQERASGREAKVSLAERVANVRSTVAATVEALKVPAAPKGSDIGAEPTYPMWEVPLGPEAPVQDLAETPGVKVDPATGDLLVPVQRRPRSPRTPVLRGTWNVEKAVQLLMDGEKVPDVAATVGVGPKSIQRVQRALVALKADPQADIPQDWKVPAEVVQVARQMVRSAI